MSFSGIGRTKGVFVALDIVSTAGAVLQPPALPVFAWDAVTSVSLTSGGVVTTHPVEDSSTPITDFVRTEPEELSVSGVLSDTPLSTSLSVFNAIRGDVPRPAAQDLAITAYELLVKIRAERRRIMILGSWFFMTSAWCPSVTASRSSGEGAGINVTATFRRIRVVRPQLVPASVDADLQAAGYTADSSTSYQSTDIGNWFGSVLQDF